MMSDMTDKAAIIARLRDLMAQPDLPARAAKRGEALINRLQTPVRVGIFGTVSSGKRAVVNALAGDDVLPLRGNLPPADLRHATKAQITLTMGDGTSVCINAAPQSDHFDPGVIFAEIGVPFANLRNMSILNVATESDADIDAALCWAAARCDIALWCTRTWSPAEQRIWARGPDVLKNHALLIAVEGVDRLSERNGLELGLCAARIDGATGSVAQADADALRQKLGAIIAAAQAEDLDAGDMLLGQFGRASAPVVPMAAARQPPAQPITPLDPASPPEALAALSRVFLHLRQGATRLCDGMPDGALTVETAQQLLSGCEETFEALLEIAEAEPALSERWPAIWTTLSDASELMLLLRIEGGIAQAGEAAVLLGQVRQEVEWALAA